MQPEGDYIVAHITCIGTEPFDHMPECPQIGVKKQIFNR